MNDDPSKRGTYPAFTDPPDALLADVAHTLFTTTDMDDEETCVEYARIAYAIIAPAAHAAGRREGLEEAADMCERWRGKYGHECADGIRRILASTPTPRHESAREMRARLGFTPLTKEQEAANLDHNLGASTLTPEAPAAPDVAAAVARLWSLYPLAGAARPQLRIVFDLLGEEPPEPDEP